MCTNALCQNRKLVFSSICGSQRLCSECGRKKEKWKLRRQQMPKLSELVDKVQARTSIRLRKGLEVEVLFHTTHRVVDGREWVAKSGRFEPFVDEMHPHLMCATADRAGKCLIPWWRLKQYGGKLGE